MQLDSIIREGPLTFCQELLLYNELFTQCPPIISRVTHIDGPLDVDAFKRAADATIAAHEPLRTTWAWRQHEPFAQVKSKESLPSSTLVEEGSDIVNTVLASLSPTNFSAASPPHMRHWIFRRGQDNHLWVFGVHHIAADAISLKLYADTFRADYKGSSEAPSPTTSIEYAQTSRLWLSSAAAQAELEWWLRKLEHLPHGEMPVRSASEPSTIGFERQELRLPKTLRDAVLRTARRERTPPAAVFLAAYAQAVSQRRGDQRPCVITNVPGRNLPGAASSSGACYNSLPLVLPSTGLGVGTLTAVANALFEALDHQGVPAPLISLGGIRQGGLALPDRVPVTFNVISHPLGDFRLPGCRLWEVDLATLGRPSWGSDGPTPLRHGGAPVRPTMDWLVNILPASIVLSVEYSPLHADRHDVMALLAEYESVLRVLCGAPVDADTLGTAGLVADWSEALD